MTNSPDLLDRSEEAEEIDWGTGAEEVYESCDLENPESCESCT